MKKHALVLMAIGFSNIVSAQAQNTIISDTFNGPDGLSANGRTPSVTDLPGGTWSAGTYWNPSIQNNTLSIGADTGASIALASSGPYVEPANITESVTFMEASDNNYGVGIGFSSTNVSSTEVYPYRNVFSGLAVTSSGDVVLWNQSSVLNTVAWSGSSSFNLNAYYTMTFTIDTTSGGISNISLTGDTADFTSLQTASVDDDVFSTPNTQNAEIWGNGPNAGDTAYFSDVNLTTTDVVAAPEPSTVALAGIGMAGLMAFRRRK